MLVVMKHGASESEVQAVVDEIERLGYEAHPMPGKQRTTVGLMGNDGGVDDARIQGLLGRARDHPGDQAVQAGLP